MYLLATAADVCSILGFLLAVAMALWGRVKGYRPMERIKQEDAETSTGKPSEKE